MPPWIYILIGLAVGIVIALVWRACEQSAPREEDVDLDVAVEDALVEMRTDAAATVDVDPLFQRRKT
jgi:uncharacterized membrane-anchored protein YhcB (DUF1043 family)